MNFYKMLSVGALILFVAGCATQSVSRTVASDAKGGDIGGSQLHVADMGGMKEVKGTVTEVKTTVLYKAEGGYKLNPYVAVTVTALEGSVTLWLDRTDFATLATILAANTKEITFYYGVELIPASGNNMSVNGNVIKAVTLK